MNIKDLNEEIELTDALKTMAESYTEIGSMELKKLRKEVEEHRIFFNDLAYIFGLLRYFSRASHIHKVSGNGKTVTILLTSNFRHHGKISSAATNFFMNFTQKTPTDQIVIGRLGLDLLKARRYPQSYKELMFKSDIPTNVELKKLVEFSKDYSQILVIYSEFKSVLSQLPTVKDMTQRQNIAMAAHKIENFAFTFILEPEIGKMIDFFDSQIKNVLLSGTFLEAQLARVASRLISMDEAQQNAQVLLQKENESLVFAKRNLLNKKMLETWVSVRATQN